MLRNTCAYTNLDSLLHNIEQAKRNLRPDTKLLAVIKANAYGHGIVEVGRYLQLKHAADYLAVAIVEEGVLLRQNGITLPILVLGAVDDDHIAPAVENDLSLAVFSEHTLLALQAEAQRQGKQSHFHVKIDSGMHRIGIQSEAAFLSFLDKLKDCANLYMQGIFTHFATADQDDTSYTDEQFKRFSAFVDIAHDRGYEPVVHCCNSGGIFLHPQYQCDMVRLGISLYGSHVNPKLEEKYPLLPVLRWKSNIANLFTLKKGEGLSYGLTFTAPKDMLIATLPVGYGDGYKRCLSNKAEVLIGAKRCKQVGTICMDQMMCDVSDVPNVKIGDEVVLIGSQQGSTITADEMAKWADTISYEILLSISDRVPRIYQ